MAKSKRAFHGRCLWPGCPEAGSFFTGRTIGMDKKWGYACEVHERVIAAENLQRLEEEAMYSRSRPSWSLGLRQTA